MDEKKYLSKKAAIGVLVVAIVGGVGGALLLGHILEGIARSIFGLTEWDFTGLAIWGSVMLVLMAIGTGALVGAFYTENKVIRWLIVAFSIPIPIVIEVVDLIVRMVLMMDDLYAHYGLV